MMRNQAFFHIYLVRVIDQGADGLKNGSLGEFIPQATIEYK
jgi:hypothetical protein